MRLIDADALMKEFTTQTPFGCGTVGIKFVDDLIKNQPTAYDVEAKVAELEKEYDLSDKEKARCMRENLLQYDEAKGYARGIDTAISIVRGKE